MEAICGNGSVLSYEDQSRNPCSTPHPAQAMNAGCRCNRRV
jgi:hypothetical protein